MKTLPGSVEPGGEKKKTAEKKVTSILVGVFQWGFINKPPDRGSEILMEGKVGRGDKGIRSQKKKSRPPPKDT